LASANLNPRPKFDLKSETFFELFPFHVIFDRKLIIISMGAALNSVIKQFHGQMITQAFLLKKPLIEFTWDDVSKFRFYYL